MGKYLQMLDELYQPEEKKQISTEIKVTKPTKALLYPFVSANAKDIQFFSDEELQGIDPTNQKEKVVKASKQELTNGATKNEDIKPSDHEIAEQLIGTLELHDDRVYIHQYLIGIYGTKRLDIVNKYLEQWQQGSDAEPSQIKKDNAGRYRANVWIREIKER